MKPLNVEYEPLVVMYMRYGRKIPSVLYLPVSSMGNGVEPMEVKLCCFPPHRPRDGAILRRYRNPCAGSSDFGCVTTVMQDVR